MGNKKFIITIIILIIIILGLGGFIAFDKLVLNKQDKVKTTQIGDVELNLTVMEHIDETLLRLNEAFNDPNTNYFGYLYSKKEINKNNFDKSAALFAAIYKDMSEVNMVFNIPGGIVRSNYEELFGKKFIYEAKSITPGNTCNIVYYKDNDTYAYIFQKPYNVYSPKYIEKSIETSAESGQITIKRKVFYIEYIPSVDGTTVTQANIYTGKDKTKLIKTVTLKNNSINVDELIGKYGSKMETYMYTFKEETLNRYDFYSIKKVK